MGSMGWTMCYWCPYWVENPYIIDGIGYPLCNMCFDWCVDEGGGPPEPSATTRCATRLNYLFPQLPDSANLLIASNLIVWHEP